MYHIYPFIYSCLAPSPLQIVSVLQKNNLHVVKKHNEYLHTNSLWCGIKGKELTDKQPNKTNTCTTLHSELHWKQVLNTHHWHDAILNFEELDHIGFSTTYTN